MKSAVMLRRPLLRACQPFISAADIRYYLTGLLVEVDEALNIWTVGSDGHGIAIARHGQAPAKTKPFKCIIPAADLAVAVRLDAPGRRDPDVPVELSGAGENWTLGRLAFTPIDGNFPDWRKVIPAEPLDTKARAPRHVHAMVQPRLYARLEKSAKALGGSSITVTTEPNNKGTALVCKAWSLTYPEGVLVILMAMVPDKDQAVVMTPQLIKTIHGGKRGKS